MSVRALLGQKIPRLLAAVDLGSNSFHLVVARYDEGTLTIIDRLREPVRLAAGFDDARNLTEAARSKALDCLNRFGQRLRELPSRTVRAVGTNALRAAHNSAQFLNEAETALGHPIEIISGIEEARIIYLGVAHTLADDNVRRLVVDIGGGSTEFIIGERFNQLYRESLYMGSVSMSERYFPEGVISRKRWNRAELEAAVELEPVVVPFENLGWQVAVGAAGTARAIRDVLVQNGWSEEGITADGLRQLSDVMLSRVNVNKLELAGLSSERAPILPGGVAILSAIFNALRIRHMDVSEGAMREGLLYDLVGRLHDDDVRGGSVMRLAARYHVDEAHAKRVEETALACLDKIKGDWDLDDDVCARMLGWSARLHEIGLDISHSQYHKHGAYIVENADIAGFSRMEQKILAALVRAHRRKFPRMAFDQLPKRWQQRAHRLAILLRLAVLLNRGRSKSLPGFVIAAHDKAITLGFPEGWEQHPLTRADLEQEQLYLEAAGYRLILGGAVSNEP